MEPEPEPIGDPAPVPSMDHDDAISLEYANSPQFWRMIEERRKEPTIPWEDAKRRYRFHE
jgi:hypothetical protein